MSYGDHPEADGRRSLLWTLLWSLFTFARNGCDAGFAICSVVTDGSLCFDL
jgi:hypothetical protein